MSLPRRSWAWWVCGALLLATMLNYMDRQTLSLTATQLKEEIDLRDGRYGNLEGTFSYAFAIGSIGFGILADRYGPRKLYPIVLVGWSLAGMATPLASWPALAKAVASAEDPGSGAYHWLFLCRTMLGLFEAGHWPCALITARNILSANDRPLGNSILQSGASMGAVLTPIVIEFLRDMGAIWQVPFVAIGAIGLLWVPLWLVLTRGMTAINTRATSATQQEPILPPPLFLMQLVTLLSIVVTISLAWQFHRAWMPKYLKEYHGYSESTANYFTSAYYLVADIGCLASGILVKWLTRRGQGVRWARVVAFGVCILLTATAVLIPSLPRGPWLFAVLLLIGAGTLGAHPQYYALSQELPTRYMGTLSGALAAASWFAVGFMQRRAGKHVEAVQSYDDVLLFVGFVPLIGLLAMIVWVYVTDKVAVIAPTSPQNH